MMNQQKLINRAYPKESSRDFYARIRQNWVNLKADKVMGPDCYASRLHQELKLEQKQGRPGKFTAFIIYLCLCLERPWENEWPTMSFSERRIGNEKNIWDKIDDILSRIPERFPPLDHLDPRVLRKYVKRKGFKLIVSWIAIDQKPFYKPARKFLLRLEKKWRSVGEQISEKLKDLNSSRIGYLVSEDPKFLDAIWHLNSQRSITKRDLYRKLRISVSRCDSILKEAEEKGLVRIIERWHKSARITYTGPED
jgi:ribosomal protein S25